MRAALSAAGRWRDTPRKVESNIGLVSAEAARGPARADAELCLERGRVVRSRNQRLEQIFAATPDYLNREAIYPATLGREPLYLDPAFKKSGLEPEIRGQIGTIITPYGLARLPRRKLSQLKVLASPYECGRVLELNETVQIEGTPYTILFKGVGCTGFARETGCENKWMLSAHRYFMPEHRERLRVFPFAAIDDQQLGALHRPFAMDELEGMLALRRSGADTERILAIYTLEEIADQQGRLHPLAYYRKSGALHHLVEPCLMVRALKCNFRLMDVVMLDELDKSVSIEALLEHLKRQYALHAQAQNPTLNDYAQWLVRKVLRQELPLILNGYELSSGRWQDLGRNISGLGEEIDLEDVRPLRSALECPYAFARHVDRQMDPLEGAFRAFAAVANFYSAEKIDPAQFAAAFFEAGLETVNKMGVDQIYDRIERKTPSERAYFNSMLKNALFDKFTRYTLFGRDAQWVREYQAAGEDLAGKLGMS